MTARNAVQTLLESDATLVATGVGAVYASNATDTPAEQLFLTIHWEDRTQSFQARGPETLVVWVHDKQRDYGRVDQVIIRLITILEAAVHLVGSDGTLTQATWTGTSGDLFDDGYNTVTKNVSFRVSSR